MERRRFVKAGLLCGAVGLVNRSFPRSALTVTNGIPQQQGAGQIMEAESGDPDAPPEVLDVNRASIEKLLPKLRRTRGDHKDDRTIALATLATAKTYVGVTRANQPEQVAKMLKLFDLPLRYANGEFIPYCASGLSFSACQAYCETDPKQSFDPNQPLDAFRRVLPDINKFYFKPHPACIEMVNDAKTRGKWLPTAGNTPQPGWLVFYDWKSDGHPNHVGMVDSAEADGLHTVEFNTSISEGGNRSNGGAVALKKRALHFVLGYIKTY